MIIANQNGQASGTLLLILLISLTGSFTYIKTMKQFNQKTANRYHYYLKIKHNINQHRIYIKKMKQMNIKIMVAQGAYIAALSNPKTILSAPKLKKVRDLIIHAQNIYHFAILKKNRFKRLTRWKYDSTRLISPYKSKGMSLIRNQITNLPVIDQRKWTIWMQAFGKKARVYYSLNSPFTNLKFRIEYLK